MTFSSEQLEQIASMDDAEKFVASPLGQTVLSLAKRDLEESSIKFADADVTDVKALTVIQIDMKVAVRFEQYLFELIQRGREVIASQQQ